MDRRRPSPPRAFFFFLFSKARTHDADIELVLIPSIGVSDLVLVVDENDLLSDVEFEAALLVSLVLKGRRKGR